MYSKKASYWINDWLHELSPKIQYCRLKIGIINTNNNNNDNDQFIIRLHKNLLQNLAKPLHL